MPEIALFGGSFDPPHVGHLLAAAYVLATDPVDELWFVPVHAHPFGKPLIGSFDHRAALCEAVAAQVPRSRVSRVEQELGGEGRTVDLLEHLHRAHPGTRWALVLGTDLNAETPQWKNFDRIRQLARIIPVQRGGHPVPPVPGVRSASGAPVPPETGDRRPETALAIPEVSSTEVRTLLRTGTDASHLVPRAVLSAIRAAGTYR
jgi:nicotinate-nucleotide adenylyltransferase